MRELSFATRRALNVVTVFATLWLSLMVLVMLFGGIADWGEFIGKTVIPALAAYVIVGVASYIFFGKLTLWHKGVSHRSADAA